MNFFKKILSNYKESKKHQEIKAEPVNLSLDDAFVHHFINKGGKFLYCTNIDEVVYSVQRILEENNWKEVICSDVDLKKIAKKVGVLTQEKNQKSLPFFTTCEHLISDKGEVMFTSNQLGSQRFNLFSDNFIVYATTSQIVKTTNEGLSSIKTRYSGNLPTNIGAIKNYEVEKIEESNLDYSTSNTKNLYLILFEDL